MKKKSLLFALLLCLSLILSACGAGKAAMDAETMIPAYSLPDSNFDVPNEGAPSDSGFKDVNLEFPESNVFSDANNKIIRTAKLEVQTTEFDLAVQELSTLTESLGGYFETADVESGGYYNQYARRTAYYVVRIPKESFVEFRDRTGEIGHVYSISESAQDVGEAYYDTEARLATLTTKRERLLALLEKADIMEDIIVLENALADVQYEIDRHTVTLRKYDSLISFSTFYIRLNEVVEIEEQVGVKESFGSRLISNLKTGAKNFVEGVDNFAIWLARNLIGVIIFAAVVFAVIVLVRKGVCHHRNRKKDG